MVAAMKGRHAVSSFDKDADAFMPQDTPGRAACHIAFEDVQIRSANGGLGNFHDCVRRRGEARRRTVFQIFLAGTEINQRFHDVSLSP